jgi:hypothetical protein
MPAVKYFLIPAILLLLSTSIFAQQKFTEGVIVYDITISSNSSQTPEVPATESQTGTFTIQIKEENVRQDIIFEDGYKYSRLSNFATEKDIILQTINAVKYAIEVSIKEQKKKNAAHYNATFTTDKDIKTIGSFQAYRGSLKYKDGNVFSFFYLKEYELKHPEIFEKMPELKGIPVSFDMPMANGFNTHFELKSISQEPVTNASFRIPEGYRIISKKEYDRLIK